MVGAAFSIVSWSARVPPNGGGRVAVSVNRSACVLATGATTPTRDDLKEELVELRVQVRQVRRDQQGGRTG
jgi:hypothetical protein